MLNGEAKGKVYLDRLKDMVDKINNPTTIGMKIFETTASLGYGQKAYLIRLNKTKNGYDYLCIGGKNLTKKDSYEDGKVVKDLEGFYVEESDYKIEDSHLYGSFLFDFFLKNQRV